ncbi:hypothetical protein APR12_000504 [Nocardia amikacinitolerans]|nr:hypothetical protein [Nocardia amikacinitolerans]
MFGLHEVFGYPHTEIVGRGPAPVRASSPRPRLGSASPRARRARGPPGGDRTVRRGGDGGDNEELLAVLVPDVTLWTDGGEHGPATSLRPVHGAGAVARLFAEAARPAARLPSSVPGRRHRSVRGALRRQRPAGRRRAGGDRRGRRARHVLGHQSGQAHAHPLSGATTAGRVPPSPPWPPGSAAPSAASAPARAASAGCDRPPPRRGRPWPEPKHPSPHWIRRTDGNPGA